MQLLFKVQDTCWGLGFRISSLGLGEFCITTSMLYYHSTMVLMCGLCLPQDHFDFALDICTRPMAVNKYLHHFNVLSRVA